MKAVSTVRNALPPVHDPLVGGVRRRVEVARDRAVLRPEQVDRV